jgi:hypothetical protein
MHTTSPSAPAREGGDRARQARPDYRGDSAHSCPACGQRGALIALGTRYDHPHRWRPWVTTRTPLYLCERCAALVAGGPAQDLIVDTVSRPVRPAVDAGWPGRPRAARSPPQPHLTGAMT